MTLDSARGKAAAAATVLAAEAADPIASAAFFSPSLSFTKFQGKFMESPFATKSELSGTYWVSLKHV